MNPFEKHGITHLSPSSINAYLAEPALWTLKYLFGVKDEGWPKAYRGQAVEAGLARYLEAREIRNDIAEGEFDRLMHGAVTTESEEQRCLLPQFLLQACEALKREHKPLPKPAMTKLKLNEIEVPIIGYIDFLFPLAGNAIKGLDLKTTERMTSSLKPDHARQVSIYRASTGHDFDVLYVAPKKWALYPLTDDLYENSMKDVKRTAASIRYVLDKVADKHEAAQLFIPKYEFWGWSDQLKREAGKVWK